MNSMLVYNRDSILLKSIRDRFIYDNLIIEGVNEYNAFKRKLLNFKYDFVVLNLSSCQDNSMELIYKVRNITSAYLLIVGRNNNSIEKIMCLERGGDFYMDNPLDIMELKAILDVINRRKKIEASKGEICEIVDMGNFRLDLLNKKINYLNIAIELTAKEFQILYILIKNPNRPYSREELNNSLLGFSSKKNSRNIDVHIKKIREKLKRVSDKELIFTSWGEGYYFRP